MLGHNTAQDAIEQDIIPALGEHFADFNLRGIFDECYTYVVGGGEGVFVMNVDEAEFWETVQRNAR